MKKNKNLLKFWFTRFLNIPAMHRWITFRKLNKLVKSSASAAIKNIFAPEKHNFLYVAASCLPYHISGYTSRTQEILKALREQNSQLNLFVLTRTGYPWDRRDSLEIPPMDQTFNEFDGIRYDHIRTPANSKLTALYAEQASLEIEKYIVQHKISCVHAASNHVNALPALIAAKRLGIPFQYEIRGLWELTRISRMPEFEQSHNFKLGLDLEDFVAKHADRVFVISEQMSRYIQKNWHLSPEKIYLLPNCVSREMTEFRTDEKHNAEKKSDNSFPYKTFTIGYAGSLIVYEGLQTLIKAVDILVHHRHLDIHLTIIGDGEYRQSLEQLSDSLNLDSNISFLGRLSPADARSKQDECDLICIPREPFEVCRIVPPIKLVEAMALGKCVVIPDLPVFKDETGVDFKVDSNPGSPSIEELSQNGSGCIFFHSGDENSLAEVLFAHMQNPKDLDARRVQAREYVLRYRLWNMFINQMVVPYDGTTDGEL